jgi:uncharacterized integral membrane protein (TIGR00698 family)
MKEDLTVNNRRIDWSSLWKNEDWMSVWIGFLILAVFITGVSFSLPKWKWSSDQSFSEKAYQSAAEVEDLRIAAEKAMEINLAAELVSLRSAIDIKGRRLIADAAAKVEAAAADIKDNELKTRALKLAQDIKGNAAITVSAIFSTDNVLRIIYLFIGLLILSLIGMALMGTSASAFILAFPIIFILAAASFFVAGNESVSYYGLEVVFWALLFGLAVSNTIGVPTWLRTAVKTEYFIKIGLVLLGAEVLFTTMAKVGAYGMIQAIIVIIAVFYVCFWVAKKLGLDDEFASILGSAVSICGVSAAIAAGGAIKGDPKKVSHTISLVLLCAIPMLILLPIIAKAFGISPAVSGAWLGGTIDTTGAVVAAGAIAGGEAMSVAVVVKMAQNVLIGVAAFLLAVWFSFKTKSAGERPTLMEIWTRFPKFVLGFIVASIVFSFLIPETYAKGVTGITSGLRSWWFTMAFLCIGLDTKIKELVAMGGGRPAAAFLIAQAFNIFWTLLIAYIIFGGILFAVPKL